MILILLLSLVLGMACGHPKQAHVELPPPPAAVATTAQPEANIPAASES